MKQAYLLRVALAGAVTLASLQACNREPDFLSQTSPSQASVAVSAAVAQRWYEAGTAAGQHQALLIDWNKSQPVYVEDEEHLIVPIGDTYDRFAASPYRAYRRLVVRQRNGQPADGCIIELLVQRSGQENEADLTRAFHELYVAQRNEQR